MTFSEQIKHPKWQKRRLEIMELAGFKCQECGSDSIELNVHHKIYNKKLKYWEYSDLGLVCLCSDCHKNHHELDHSIKVLTCGMPLEKKYRLLMGILDVTELC